MTGQRDEERRRAEDEERLRVEKERRGEELREAWRQHHPSQSEQDQKGWPKKRPLAWTLETPARPPEALVRRAQSVPSGVGCSGNERVRRYVVDEHEDLQELLTRLNNVRDSMEAALGYVRGIEDDYRRGLLEAHIRGALREINEQITELVARRKR
jgi:hypothetical protein